jgi:hypothetical protein
MQGPSVTLSDDDSDSVIEINPSNYRPSAFQIPSRMPVGMGSDMLINKRKISSDGAASLMSLSAGSVSSASGSESASDASGSASGDTDETDNAPYGHHQSQYNMAPADRMMNERARLEAEQNEKREILFKMDRLESRGYTLPRRFTLESNLEEMRNEYDRIVREKELDASIHFQQKMMMAFVTGVEFLNTKWDPFSVRLSGWSETVQDEKEDYTDIFIDLHDKYKGSGKKMAPELRLLLTLSGSAFMFHLTNNMFKSTTTPGVEELLRSNPDLMRQFQSAAINKMGGQGAPQQQQQSAPQPQQQQQSPMGGIFSMMGNMFGAPLAAQAPRMPMNQAQPMNQSASQRPPPPQQMPQQIHQNINTRPPMQSQRMETLSMSGDDEITSIIEDTADLVGIIRSDRKSVGSASTAGGGRRGVRKQAPQGRTLQL